MHWKYVKMLLWFLLVTITASAQETVFRGFVRNYSITPVSAGADYEYTWSASGGTSSDFGNGAVSKGILWDGPPGLYEVYVFPTDKKTGCKGNIQTILIQLLEYFIRWQKPVLQSCNGRNPRVGLVYTASNRPWILELQVDDMPAVSVKISGGSSVDLELSDFVDNSTIGTGFHTLRILGISFPGGQKVIFDGTEPDAVNHSCRLEVNPGYPLGTIEFVKKL